MKKSNYKSLKNVGIHPLMGRLDYMRGSPEFLFWKEDRRGINYKDRDEYRRYKRRYNFLGQRNAGYRN